jgi:hypothetical protein
MKKLFLGILTVITVGNIAGQSDNSLTNNYTTQDSEQYMFSKEIELALKEVDSVKF